MNQPENLGNFIRENKSLFKEYLETRLDIYRLQAIRAGSKSAGYLVWILVSIFLLFLVAIFAGLVLGFWLSDLTGSFIKGFAITTGILVFIVILLALLRKSLFVNPVVRKVIDQLSDDDTETNGNNF
jgi:hypothetical protein